MFAPINPANKLHIYQANYVSLVFHNVLANYFICLFLRVLAYANDNIAYRCMSPIPCQALKKILKVLEY